MVRHTLNILQQKLQDFLNVSDHFGTSCIKGLILISKHCKELTHNKNSIDGYEALNRTS